MRKFTSISSLLSTNKVELEHSITSNGMDFYLLCAKDGYAFDTPKGLEYCLNFSDKEKILRVMDMVEIITKNG